MGWLLGVGLITASLRHVYAVGRGANDHAVALVIVASMLFYMALLGESEGPIVFALVYGQIGIWGLFFSIHRRNEASQWLKRLLVYPSQVAYAFAFWGWLAWGLRLPWASSGVVGWFEPGLWLVPPFALALLGTLQAYLGGFELRKHKVEGLPGRVVHLSDIHASALMHKTELERLVRDVNLLEPEVVLITGDLVMPFSENDYGYLLASLRAVEAPIVCCPGNHDLPVLDGIRVGLSQIGARMLVDEQIILSSRSGRVFEITGVNFHWAKARDHLDQAMVSLNAAPTGACRILLAHDPRLGPWIPCGRFDLVLSGHTHGGQVAANMLGWSVSVLRLLGVRDQGWWEANGARQYVHRGNWFSGLPPRMGVAGEIAVFDAANQ
jgi:predicted MPP superfamily phosphohydrolase